MSTWLPQDVPPGFEPNADALVTAAPPSPAVPPEFRAVGWPPPAGQPASGLRLNQPWSKTRILVYSGIIALVVTSVLTYIDWREANVDYSPNYTGTPVEAADAADGLTVVGLDNSVAYRIQPGWVDIENYTELVPRAAQLVEEDGYVGAHLTAPISHPAPDAVVVYSLDHDGPRRSLTELLDVWIEEFIRLQPVTTVVTNVPITTTTGLRGYEATATLSSESEAKQVRVAVLGNGGNVTVVQWLTPQATIDEVAYMELLNSVRIDA